MKRLWINFLNLPTWFAMNHICRLLKEDEAWREGWRSNIAMAIYDSSRPVCYCGLTEHEEWCPMVDVKKHPLRYASRAITSEQCNFAAERFLKLLTR